MYKSASAGVQETEDRSAQEAAAEEPLPLVESGVARDPGKGRAGSAPRRSILFARGGAGGRLQCHCLEVSRRRVRRDDARDGLRPVLAFGAKTGGSVGAGLHERLARGRGGHRPQHCDPAAASVVLTFPVQFYPAIEVLEAPPRHVAATRRTGVVPPGARLMSAALDLKPAPYSSL